MGPNMTLSLSGGADTVFKAMSVVDLIMNKIEPATDPNQALTIAQSIVPMVSTTGDPETGNCPQAKQTFSSR